MAKILLRFADATLERAFVQSEAQRALPQRRLFSWFAIASGPVFAVLPTLTPMARVFDIVIGAVLISAGGAGIYLSASRQRSRGMENATLITVILISTLYVVIAAVGPLRDVLAGAHVVLSLHLVAVAAALRLRIAQSLPICVLTVVAIFVVMFAGGRYDAASLRIHVPTILGFLVMGLFAGHQREVASRAEFVQTAALELEQQRSDTLLRNILPDEVAQRLKLDSQAIADGFAEVTVLFADIVGFTPLSARLSPQQVVALLDRIFTAFDALADQHGVEKIKTIGDAYMLASGLPVPRPDHADAAAAMALDMLLAVQRIAKDVGEPLDLRIGLNSGHGGRRNWPPQIYLRFVGRRRQHRQQNGIARPARPNSAHGGDAATPK